MSIEEVTHAVGREGKPVFKFIDEARYDCHKFLAKDTGVPYYFLWEGDSLRSVAACEKGHPLERVSGMNKTSDTLPHETGFEILLAPFRADKTPSDTDFAADKEGFRPLNQGSTAGEWLMWSPIIVISLPFLPLTLPLAILDHAQAAIGYERAYRLDVGMAPEDVKRHMDAPDHVLGDPASYGVWVYHHTPAEGEHINVSVGFRSGRATWIRYGYDAHKDSIGVDDSNNRKAG
jgi:hypothetical protein